MAEPTMQHVLARLAAQDAKVAALEGKLARRQRRWRRASRAPALLVALVIALAPLTLLAASPFTDLTGGVHDANIEAIYTAGVTTGCVPKQKYCPAASVTREEMASFLARLGGLGTNRPVANAARLAIASPAPGGPTFAANDLARVARTVLPNNLLASPPQPAIDVTASFPTFQTVGTVVINVPAAGFVLITAQSLSATTNNVAIYSRLREAASGEASPPVSQGVGVSLHVTGPYDVTAGSLLNATLAPTHVFPVAAAGTYTFALEASTNHPEDTYVHLLFDTTITALYVPFGYDGGTALAP